MVYHSIWGRIEPACGRWYHRNKITVNIIGPSSGNEVMMLIYISNGEGVYKKKNVINNTIARVVYDNTFSELINREAN